jgi:tRNA(fMet)-specific endonuclease VapC
MLILDTDVISIVQAPPTWEYERLVARLEQVDRSTVFVAIVSFEEQTRGWLAQIANARTPDKQVGAYARLHKMLKHYCERQVLDFDRAANQRFQELLKSKIRIGTLDLRIAAIALIHGAKVLTRNVRDFRKVPGLDVEDWTTA